MTTVIDRLLRKLTKTGIRNGFGGGGAIWLVLVATVLVLRRARRLVPAQTIILKPGESVTISPANAVEPAP